MPRAATKEKGRLTAAPDPDEDFAIQHAAQVVGVPLNVAHNVVSCWIMARAARAAGERLVENLVFDLGDAKLRGVVVASLSQIGGALGHLPPDVPLFALERDQVVDAFVAAIQVVDANRVSLDEKPTVLDDEIPFG